MRLREAPRGAFSVSVAAARARPGYTAAGSPTYHDSTA